MGNGTYLCDSARGVPCTATSAASKAVENPVDRGLALASEPKITTPYGTVMERVMPSAQKPEDVQQAAQAAITSGIHVTGESQGRTTLYARGSSNEVRLPSIRIDRLEGRLTFRGQGAVGVSNRDELVIPALDISSGTVEVASSLDQVHVLGDLRFEGRGATLNMNSPAGNSGFERQLVLVSGDFGHGAGSTNANGQEIKVIGDYRQAALDSLGQPGAAHATFNLGSGGEGVHTVNGDVVIGPDTSGATGATNRYMLGGGQLNLRGNLHFAGSGDTDNGLAGTIKFAGTETQTVYQGPGARSAFGSVEIDNSGGGVSLLSDVTQNASGTLKLARGFILSGSGDHSWAVMNDQYETDLVGRITAGESEGDRAAVWKGSRRSFVAGRTVRAITRGNAGGGLVGGGYFFPTGSLNRASDATSITGEFRPIILQMPDDLGTASTATASTYQLDDMEMMAWPDENLVVEAAGGQSLTLDNFANMFWKVEFEEIPAHDPNIRIVADGLPNVFDISRLRIVQWDCEGTNPRLAGVYDLSEDPTDDESFALNDMLNGLPNITQEGVNVTACNIFGIASNFLENPISINQIRRGLARVQFINNVIGLPMDVYVDDIQVRNNFAPHEATGFNILAAGERKIRLLPANAPASSLALLEATIRLTNTMNYTVIAHGDVSRFDLVVKDRARLNARRAGNVEFFLVHGAKNLGEVDVRILDATDNNSVLDHLANNIDFNDVGAYISMAPGAYNFEITTANNDRQIDVFRLEFGDLENAALTLNLSGIGKSSADDLTVFGVDSRGDTFFPQVVTAAESGTDLLSEFVLLGNYPNPFNPSTRIQFDLPETADITVHVVDMLGRSVMILPTQSVEAGANRSIELDASNLASGTYFYRVTASTSSGPAVRLGRMVLLK